MSSRIHAHIRSNVVGYVALFIALNGVAYAGALKANKVKSKHIADGQVLTQDLGDAAVTTQKLGAGAVTTQQLADGAVNSSKVADDSLTGSDVDETQLDPSVIQTRVGSGCSPGEAIRSINANGTVACETDDSGGGGPPTGPAGGDLTGTYPNPDIDADAVGSPEVGPNALGGNDIDESTLSGVNASLLDGVDTATIATPNRIYVSTGAGVLPADTVNSSSVANSTLDSNDLANNAVVGGTGGDVSDDSLTAADLATSAVVGGAGGDVQDNTLSNDDVGPSAVGASELANNAVVGGLDGDVQDDTNTTEDIQNPTIGGADIVQATAATGLKRGDVGLVQTPTTTVQSVPANSCFEFGTSVSGADLGSPVILGPPSVLNAGITATGFVSAAGMVTLRVCNVTTAAITLNSGTWSVVVLEP
jgi:hypothetical protein